MAEKKSVTDITVIEDIGVTDEDIHNNVSDNCDIKLLYTHHLSTLV